MQLGSEAIKVKPPTPSPPPAQPESATTGKLVSSEQHRKRKEPDLHDAKRDVQLLVHGAFVQLLRENRWQIVHVLDVDYDNRFVLVQTIGSHQRQVVLGGARSRPGGKRRK